MPLTKPRKYLLLTAITIGALSIIFLLLFALANSEWIVINLPALPWSQESTVPLLEARLWVVMAIPIGIGALLVAMILLTERFRVSRATKPLKAKVASLENEIDRLNNLLVIAQKSAPRSGKEDSPR